MAEVDTAIRRIWREFNVDGQQATGRRKPLKPDIWTLGPIIEGHVAASVSTEASARSAADIALGFLISGATGPLPGQFVDATIAVALASIDPAQTVLYTGGYATAGDGGAARFVRSETETWLQSLDGAYWQLAVNNVYAEMCGAVGPGPHDEAIARAFGDAKIVHLGPRGFVVTAPIVIPEDGALIGAGRGVTYLAATGCTAIEAANEGRAPVAIDMTITGDNTPATWGLLFSNNHSGALAQRVDVFGFGSNVPSVGETAAERGGGIGMFGSWEGTNMWGAVLDQVRVGYCGVGIYGDHLNTLVLLNSISRLNYGNNLEIQYCIALNSVGGQYEAVLTVAPDETPTIYPATAIKLTAVVGGTLDAIYCENMTESLVKLINCEAVSIAGAYVDNAGDESTGTMIEVIASAACSIGPIKISGLYTADKRAITFDSACYNNTVSSLEIVGSAADFATAIDDQGVGNYIGPCTINGTLYPPMSAPRLPTYTVAAANALASGRRLAGAVARVSNGDGGASCLAISDGTTWYRIPLGAAISAS